MIYDDVLADTKLMPFMGGIFKVVYRIMMIVLPIIIAVLILIKVAYSFEVTSMLEFFKSVRLFFQNHGFFYMIDYSVPIDERIPMLLDSYRSENISLSDITWFNIFSFIILNISALFFWGYSLVFENKVFKFFHSLFLRIYKVTFPLIFSILLSIIFIPPTLSMVSASIFLFLLLFLMVYFLGNLNKLEERISSRHIKKT